jgi:hypothetical protein
MKFNFFFLLYVVYIRRFEYLRNGISVIDTNKCLLSLLALLSDSVNCETF